MTGRKSKIFPFLIIAFLSQIVVWSAVAKNDEGAYFEALHFLHEGKTDQAISRFQATAEGNSPYQDQARIQLIRIYVQSGKGLEEILTLLQAIQNSTLQLQGWNAAISGFGRNGQVVEGLNLAYQMQAVLPEKADEGFFRAGKAFFLMDFPVDAMELFQKVLMEYPESPRKKECYSYISRIYQDSTRYQNPEMASRFRRLSAGSISLPEGKKE